MKVQKLGLVLGINMAAACLMMQGCKATKPGRDVPPPQPDRTITVVSRPPAKHFVKNDAEPAEVPEQKIVVAPAPVVTPPPPPPVAQPQPVAPPPPVAQPQPSAVATVKPLPTAKPKSAKPIATKKAAAAAPAEAAATEEYVVRSGDTLFIISKRTNIRQRAILAVNPGLKADRLRVGQKIKLPAAAPAAKVEAAAPVQKDAALAELLKEDGSKDADKKADDAKVKSAAAPVSDAAANTNAPVKTKSAFVEYNGPTKEYIVKSGDSLGKIAFESGITIRALKAMNGLTKDSLRIGQKLKIPAEKQVAAAKPAVKDAAAKKANAAATVPAEAKKSDDAAKKEAAKDAAKPAEEKSAKAAKPAEVKPAETAKPAEEKQAEATTPAEEKPADAAKSGDAAKSADKPAAGEVAPKEEAKQPEAEAAPAETSGPTHVVKDGEDLVTIAIMYAISPSVLMDLNNISMTDQDKLKPGTVLKLPANVKK